LNEREIVASHLYVPVFRGKLTTLVNFVLNGQSVR
jgi:hypothetical protein